MSCARAMAEMVRHSSKPKVICRLLIRSLIRKFESRKVAKEGWKKNLRRSTKKHETHERDSCFELFREVLWNCHHFTIFSVLYFLTRSIA